MFGVVGETVGQVWTSDRSGTVPAGVTAFLIKQVTTLVPSFKGAAIGAYDDPLQPVVALSVGSKYWLEVKIAAVGQACFSTLLCIQGKAGPMVTMPFYAEMSHSAIGAAANLPDLGPSQAARFALTKQFSAMLRANGVEPFKQWYTAMPAVLNGKLDLDTKFAGVASFRDMVITGAIFPPMIFSWAPPGAPANVIAATAASKAAGDIGECWTYDWDEQEGVADAQALAQAQKYQASGCHGLITRNWTAQFAQYADWIWPTMNAIKDQGPWTGLLGGAYMSCPAQGNCGNTTSPNPPIGYPMMVLDAPASHARAYAWALQKLGAPRGMYYSSTQMLSTALNPGGQYTYGGNGDGTIVYYGTDGQPWPSLRLKHLYRGLQDVWYLSHGGKNVMTSANATPATEAVFEAERARVWGLLP